GASSVAQGDLRSSECVSGSVRGLERGEDRARDAAAVADLVTVLAGPLADLRELGAVGGRAATRGPAGARRTGGLAAVPDPRGEGVAQLSSVGGGDVDLVRDAIER